ncbi:MAG: saccharopine dehydrogenase NADP-binding domain-containing protein [Actinomycetota bacterium]|nr:saccharopine dehydrogenase NADP-binding domain-containing protein [Actinomycetota bacterium]
MAERDLDVVVFGATGVTGRRVAAYLAERAPATGARWAAAGRDPGRVRRVLGEDGVRAPEVLAADAGDPASLFALASRTRVVLNLVGPYTPNARPVIEACVDAGAHYVDLTGEIPFVRQVIDQVHDRAVHAGVKVVQVCGFESLPPDLAVALAAQEARGRWHEDLAHVDVEVSWRLPPGRPRPSDAISGGTFQSLVAVADSDTDASLVTDPAALVTDPHVADEVRERSPITVGPRRNARGDVLAPMAPAAFINPAVVHRTRALWAAEQSTHVAPFTYREAIALPGSAPTMPLRWAAAGVLSGVQVAMLRTARARPEVRRRAADALRRVVPSSGFGPAPDRLEGWQWRLLVQARTTGGARVEVHVDATGHPGYLATARMVGEAGLMLAEHGTTPERAGCLTPATALGTDHVDRFRHARLRFTVAG